MAYIQGDGRNQGTLFPVVVDDFVPTDHVCRVIDAFVEKLPLHPSLSKKGSPLRFALPAPDGLNSS